MAMELEASIGLGVTYQEHTFRATHLVRENSNSFNSTPNLFDTS